MGGGSAGGWRGPRSCQGRTAHPVAPPPKKQMVLGPRRYLRWRLLIVPAALAAYAFHPGGGLYRDAVVAAQAGGAAPSLLSAASLGVRLLVASRAVFWGFLVWGYQARPGPAFLFCFCWFLLVFCCLRLCD